MINTTYIISAIIAARQLSWMPMEKSPTLYPLLQEQLIQKTKAIEDPGYHSGNQFPNAPKFTGNCWLDYDATGSLSGLSLGTGIFYKNKLFNFISNDPSLVIPSNYTLDVSAVE